MKTISVNLYSINELEPKAKQKALNNLRQDEFECGLVYQNVSEDFANILEERKLDLKASYSLSHCQGDGVAFEGSLSKNDLVRLELATQEQIDKSHFMHIDIKTVGRYTHENSMCYTSYFDIDKNEDIMNIEAIIEEKVVNFIRALSLEFEKIGYENIDYYTSDEVLIETSEANEWTYESNGEMRNE